MPRGMAPVAAPFSAGGGDWQPICERRRHRGEHAEGRTGAPALNGAATGASTTTGAPARVSTCRPIIWRFEARSGPGVGPADLVATAAIGDVEAEKEERDEAQLPPQVLSLFASPFCSLRRQCASGANAALRSYLCEGGHSRKIDPQSLNQLVARQPVITYEVELIALKAQQPYRRYRRSPRGCQALC